MAISNNYIFRIANKDYWWGHNKYYSYNYKEYKIRAAFGMSDRRLFKEIKRKQV